MQPSEQQLNQWFREARNAHPTSYLCGKDTATIAHHVAKHAYAAAADTQLEVCADFLDNCLLPLTRANLMENCRPKPLSKKQKALKALDRLSKSDYPANMQDDADYEAIRSALDEIPGD